MMSNKHGPTSGLHWNLGSVGNGTSLQLYSDSLRITLISDADNGAAGVPRIEDSKLVMAPLRVLLFENGESACPTGDDDMALG